MYAVRPAIADDADQIASRAELQSGIAGQIATDSG